MCAFGVVFFSAFARLFFCSNHVERAHNLHSLALRLSPFFCSLFFCCVWKGKLNELEKVKNIREKKTECQTPKSVFIYPKRRIGLRFTLFATLFHSVQLTHSLGDATHTHKLVVICLVCVEEQKAVRFSPFFFPFAMANGTKFKSQLLRRHKISIQRSILQQGRRWMCDGAAINALCTQSTRREKKRSERPFFVIIRMIGSMGRQLVA